MNMVELNISISEDQITLVYKILLFLDIPIEIHAPQKYSYSVLYKKKIVN